MEKLMLARLSAIVTQIEEYTTKATAQLQNLENVENAQVTAQILEKATTRFSNELYDYFKLSTTPSADDISSFSEIQLKGEEILSELNIKLKNKRVAQGEASSSVTSNTGSQIQTSRLPKLDLPQYDGDVLLWHQFFDQFNSNIGNRNLSEVDKLLYLKASLTGNAKLAIDGLEITNKNYEIAIKTLKERFGKDSHIIDAHYSALYKIKTSGRSPEEIRKTMSEVERHLRVLQSLGEDTNHNHLRFLILEKFPEDVVYETKMKMKTESIEEIRRCLETIISAREDASRSSQGNVRKSEIYTTDNFHIKAMPETHSRDTLSSKESKDKFQNFNKLRQHPYRNSNNNNRSQPIRKISNHGRFQQRDFNQRELNQGNQNSRKRQWNGSSKDNSSEPRPKLARKYPCIFCKGQHFNDTCQTVKTLDERRQKLKAHCFKCFSTNHRDRDCKLNILCVHCKQRNSHNRALCPKVTPNKQEPTHTFHAQSNHSTALQTAVVNVSSADGTSTLKCRVLLDSGSQRSYVTQEIANKLNLPIEEYCKLSVFTFASHKPQEFDSSIVKLKLNTRLKKDIILYANIVPSISEEVPCPQLSLNQSIPKTHLADDGSTSTKIDILIGNDYYFSLISTGKVKLRDNLYLIESEFGWILSGKLDTPPEEEMSAVTYFQAVETKLTRPDLPLDSCDVKCLWELESIGICDSPKISRDEEAVQHFNENTKVIQNRYHVKWPWIEYPPALPSNLGLAKGRLVSTLKRLNKSQLQSYNDTLQEQLKIGIIETIPPKEITSKETNHPVHYLPHHGIDSPGKPTRIVYDASAKIKGNKSLNECLYCGPIMLEDLIAIFLRFRTHRVGIIADVEKAFLQLALQTEDKDVTRFLWLKDINEPATESNLLHMRFCRVPFGIISSPFLLNATIRHHLSNQRDTSLRQLAKNIYVDNLVTGTESVEEAVVLYNNVKETFQEISMNMRTWSSNSEKFMQHIPKRDRHLDKEIKVLGLNWNLERDSIELRCKPITDVNTKRGVLKVIASIYDPMGYGIPSVLQARIFLQELWKIKQLKWDTQLPPNLQDKWVEAVKELKEIESISLDRYYFVNSEKRDVKLHCFVDASLQAYAAVVYMTTKTKITFVIGKSRLTPIKDQEVLKIPRLELLGALIGSRLIEYVKRAIPIQFTEQTLWTDSQIVIDWYNSDKLLTPFVARRIAEIKRNTNLKIRKVPTELNPADVATRPQKGAEDKQFWLTGPKFLLQNPKSWPPSRKQSNKDKSEPNNSFFCGEGPASSHIAGCKSEKYPIEKLDSNNKKLQSKRQIERIQDATELQELKEIQRKFFTEEVKGKGTNLSRNLGLFLDEEGLLRCKGRMRNTNWPFEMKYPILIPKDCNITDEIIQKIHEENFHVGVNHTLSLIRQKYWVSQGRRYVQKILKKCKRCIKHTGGPYKLPPTPALPPERVNYSTPYTYCGVDYFGPVNIKNDNVEKVEKRWICLFSCLAVRAIFLEVVKDLTAQEFILALRRFIAARGKPAVMVSDNALHFKLSAEVLVSEYYTKNRIIWKFIPQLSPWYGGFYERLVGIVKNCMRRTLTNNLLSESHLKTIIKEVEAVVNTRPLTCVGSEVENILSPSSFLNLGKCLIYEPEFKAVDQDDSTTKRNLIESWKYGQTILNEFKEMFTNQYLPSLRERYQHSHKQHRILSHRQPKIGDVVQLKGENKNREGWKVGKITALILGADGLCRVAKVMVGDKEYTRSVGHLYPLELEEDIPVIKMPDREQGNIVPIPSFAQQHEEGSSDLVDNPVEGMDVVQSETLEERELPLEAEPMTSERNNDSQPESEHTEITPSGKIQRTAFLRAREKIRDWTRQLSSIF